MSTLVLPASNSIKANKGVAPPQNSKNNSKTTMPSLGRLPSKVNGFGKEEVRPFPLSALSAELELGGEKGEGELDVKKRLME